MQGFVPQAPGLATFGSSFLLFPRASLRSADWNARAFGARCDPQATLALGLALATPALVRPKIASNFWSMVAFGSLRSPHLARAFGARSTRIQQSWMLVMDPGLLVQAWMLDSHPSGARGSRPASAGLGMGSEPSARIVGSRPASAGLDGWDPVTS